MRTYSPSRDYVSRYLGNNTRVDDSLYESASIHLGILRDMKIKLIDAEMEHLFSLPSEVAIENYCHKIIMARL